MEFWPGNLIPANIKFRIKPMSSFGPTSFSGKRQTVAQDAGYWVAELSNFPVNETDQILEWRGTIAALEGSANDLVIGPYDYLRSPALDGVDPVVYGIPHSDGSSFSDGSEYGQSTIQVVTAAAASLRATQIVLSVVQAGPLRKGMYFTAWGMNGGVLTPRMYIITAPPELADGKVAITFRPPLRAAIAAGQDIDFADPKLLMNLSDQDSGALDLEYGRFSSPSLSLEESWNGIS